MLIRLKASPLEEHNILSELAFTSCHSEAPLLIVSSVISPLPYECILEQSLGFCVFLNFIVNYIMYFSDVCNFSQCDSFTLTCRFHYYITMAYLFSLWGTFEIPSTFLFFRFCPYFTFFLGRIFFSNLYTCFHVSKF